MGTNYLVLARVEILSLLLAILFIFYTNFYNIRKSDKHYHRQLYFTVVHIIVGLINIYLNSHADMVPRILNNLSHFIFYSTAFMTFVEFCCYIINLCYEKKVVDKFYHAGIAFTAVYMLSFNFLPITIGEVEGSGGVYSSSGPGVLVGFGAALVGLLLSLVVILINRKKLSVYIKKTIAPTYIIIGLLIIVQVIRPEFLFTGGMLIILDVSLMIISENPAYMIEQNLINDNMESISNKEDFYKDLETFNKQFVSNKDKVFTFAFININNLKMINDDISHAEGDKCINTIAARLVSSLTKASDIYRMNGNEFSTIYTNVDEKTVNDELKLFESSISILNVDSDYKIDISIGYAISNNNYMSLYNVVDSAHFAMYNHKSKYQNKGEEKEIIKIEDNITGLTSHLFDVLKMDHENDLIFICNTRTNVARLSDNWKEKFNLPSKYVSNFIAVWSYYIKEDEREEFIEKMSDVIHNNREKFEISFHAIDRRENYAKCVLKGIQNIGIGDNPGIISAYMKIVDE